jgi:hypothetical protein
MKNFFNWLVSLFGVYWAVVGVWLAVICIVGLLNMFLITALSSVSLFIWVRKDKSRVQKTKETFNSIILYFKDWWASRPSLTR